MEIDAAQLGVEFVKHAVITHAQFEFGPALQALVRETLEPCPHLVHFPLHGSANCGRQVVECAGKSRRPNLERGGHGSTGLTCGVVSCGDLAPRLIELGFQLIGEFELVFQIILEPCAQLFEFRGR